MVQRDPRLIVTEGKVRRILRLYFTYIMLFFSALGIVLITIGVLSGYTVISAVGSSLFSASTISAIFKVMGFDIYITHNLTELMISNNTIIEQDIETKFNQNNSNVEELIHKTIGSAMSDSKFLDVLSEEQCKKIVQVCIQKMRKGTPSTAIYKAFDKLSDELAGLVAENRHYIIGLELAKAYGQHVLKSTVKYSCRVINQSTEKTIPLFENNTVIVTNTTVPRNVNVLTLANPEDLTRFVSLSVNEEPVEPDEKKHYWKDPNDKKLGAGFVIKCSRTIAPNSPVNISITTESLLDDIDYVIRRFVTFTDGITLTVTHPPEIDIDVFWFSPENIHINKPERKRGYYEQAVDGVFLPGMGFMVAIKRRK